MAEYDGLTTFRKSGYQRLRDAEHLLNPPLVDKNEMGAASRHMRGAMYLSGYGVECLLKAYLISHYSHQRLSDTLVTIREAQSDTRDICGSAGHDLRYLLSLTGLEERMTPMNSKQMSICAKWRSTWRYNPQPAVASSAHEMVRAARALVEWINSQI